MRAHWPPVPPVAPLPPVAPTPPVAPFPPLPPDPSGTQSPSQHQLPAAVHWQTMLGASEPGGGLMVQVDPGVHAPVQPPPPPPAPALLSLESSPPQLGQAAVAIGTSKTQSRPNAIEDL